MSPRRGRLALLAVAIALALPGCAVAAPTVEGSTDSRGVTQVTLENSSLDLDADRIFAEVQALVDEDASPRPPIYVLQGEEAGSGAFGYPFTPYGFVEDLALTEVSSGGDSAAGFTDGFATVYLIPGEQSRTDRVKVLVHEYVHVVQRRAGLLPWQQASLGGDIPTDLAQTRLALTEGPAVWATDAYVERHLPETVSPQSTRIRRAYEESKVGGRYFLARYYFGNLGVDRRIDSPTQLRELYEGDVPNTTEQLIHGYAPTEEPPRRFGVEIRDGRGPTADRGRDFQAEGPGETGWRVDDPGDEDVMGELFIRVALSRNLTLVEAADAADGWGYDRLVEYERNDTSAFVWVTRWDDAANASAFENAVDTYTDRRSTGPEHAFRVERLDPEFVVVYSGPPPFVERAGASRTAEGVRVSLGS